MNIVYITDSNYAMPTCVSVTSLICNTPADRLIKIYIIADRLSDDEINRFYELNKDNVQITIISVNSGKYESVAERLISKKLHVTPAALYKFSIAELLVQESKVLYLDGDVIVNDDISELFDLEIADYYMAAVIDMGDNYGADGYSRLARRVGFLSKAYYNSGVMLLNLDKLRKEKTQEALLKYREEKTNYFMDQDAFNYVMANRTYAISQEYNFLTGKLLAGEFKEINDRYYNGHFQTEEECINKQKILHFTTGFKPWIYNVPICSEVFMRYYRNSPYRDRILVLKDLIAELFNKHVYTAKQIRAKQWRFPKEAVKKDSKVIIYGAGDIGKDFSEWISDTGYCELTMIVDRNYERIGSPVKAPEEILNTNFDKVLIAVYDEDVSSSIMENLLRLGVKSESIVSIHQML